MKVIITLKAKGPNLSAQMSEAEVTKLQIQRGPWGWGENRSLERGACLPMDTAVSFSEEQLTLMGYYLCAALSALYVSSHLILIKPLMWGLQWWSSG